MIKDKTNYSNSTIYRAAGILLMLFGFPMSAIMAIAIFVSKLSEVPGVIAMFVLLGLLPSYIGFRLFKKGKSEIQTKQDTEIEIEIMKLAERKGGRLTPTDMTLNLQTDLELSRQLLDKFVIKGTADTEVSNNGAIIYIFRDLIKD